MFVCVSCVSVIALRYFWVRYSNVYHYVSSAADQSAAPLPSTFSVFLFPAGSIEIRYDTVVDPAPFGGWNIESPTLGTIPVRRPWMVGIRAPNNVYPTAEFATQWNTTRPGTYLPRKFIRSNTTAVFCPLGRMFATTATRLLCVHIHCSCSDRMWWCWVVVCGVMFSRFWNQSVIRSYERW